MPSLHLAGKKTNTQEPLDIKWITCCKKKLQQLWTAETVINEHG